jgi:hypothetical protein
MEVSMAKDKKRKRDRLRRAAEPSAPTEKQQGRQPKEAGDAPKDRLAECVAELKASVESRLPVPVESLPAPPNITTTDPLQPSKMTMEDGLLGPVVYQREPGEEE